jgi:hypothetical protein
MPDLPLVSTITSFRAYKRNDGTVWVFNTREPKNDIFVWASSVVAGHDNEAYHIGRGIVEAREKDMLAKLSERGVSHTNTHIKKPFLQTYAQQHGQPRTPTTTTQETLEDKKIKVDEFWGQLSAIVSRVLSQTRVGNDTRSLSFHQQQQTNLLLMPIQRLQHLLRH